MDNIHSSNGRVKLVEKPHRWQEFVIGGGIMPRREVHILAGASGCGKSTLLLQVLDNIIEGLPVWGEPTTRIKAGYLVNDRSTDEISRTEARVNPRHSIPSYSLLTDGRFTHARTPEVAIRHLKVLHPEIDFVIYDPISYNVENVNSAREVGSLLRKLTSLCHELNLTILILHHTAKVKTDATYANPRQRMAGCGAWGGYSNLNLILEEEVESDPENPSRLLYVCPRNGAPRKIRYLLDESGCFVEQAEKITVKGMEATFATLSPGSYDMEALSAALKVPMNSTFYRAVRKWKEDGRLAVVEGERGRYVKA